MGINQITKLLKLRSDRPSVTLTSPKLKLAFLISRIFGPVPLLIFLWLLTAVKSGIGFWKALWVYPLILLLTLLIPTAITSFFIAKKKADIEWQNINDRKKYLLPVVVSSLVILNTLLYLLTNRTIFHLSLVLSTIVLSMGAIWVFFNFKISGHMVVATMAISGVILFFGFQFIWLAILLIPLVWARHTLKVHSYAELIAGILLPSAISLAAIAVFGWPNIQ